VANGKSKPNVGVIVGVVLVVVVLGAWAFISLRSRASSSGSVEPSYSASVVGGTVVAGGAAKNTVDVYEDFLCPYCGALESRDGNNIIRAVNDGDIQVVYHPVAILNTHTAPTGYSLRAANAGLCSAVSGFFPKYHRQLYQDQPAEGSAGLSNQQLLDEAQKALGSAPPAAFASCVTTGKYDKAVTAETLRASTTPALRAPGTDGFGTPTVIVNGKYADVSDDTWLSDLTKAPAN
jgi:protein-disulfide isomerase